MELAKPARLEDGKKEYVVPGIDHPIRKRFAEGLADAEFGTELKEARIEIVMVYPYITPKVVANVRRVTASYKLFTGFDYVVQVSGDFWDILDEETQRIVMFHECEHMIPLVDKAGNTRWCLRTHDLIDFLSVVDKHGVKWLRSAKDRLIELRNEGKKDNQKQFDSSPVM